MKDIKQSSLTPAKIASQTTPRVGTWAVSLAAAMVLSVTGAMATYCPTASAITPVSPLPVDRSAAPTLKGTIDRASADGTISIQGVQYLYQGVAPKIGSTVEFKVVPEGSRMRVISLIEVVK